eukprot:3274194-Rhodomonas_salina.1
MPGEDSCGKDTERGRGGRRSCREDWCGDPADESGAVGGDGGAWGGGVDADSDDAAADRDLRSGDS